MRAPVSLPVVRPSNPRHLHRSDLAPTKYATQWQSGCRSRRSPDKIPSTSSSRWAFLAGSLTHITAASGRHAVAHPALEDSMVSSINPEARPVTRWALLAVPLICWLGLVSDGYDLFSYGATLPGMIGVDPWNITAGSGGRGGSSSRSGRRRRWRAAGTLTDSRGRRRRGVPCRPLGSRAMI